MNPSGAAWSGTSRRGRPRSPAGGEPSAQITVSQRHVASPAHEALRHDQGPGGARVEGQGADGHRPGAGQADLVVAGIAARSSVTAPTALLVGQPAGQRDPQGHAEAGQAARAGPATRALGRRRRRADLAVSRDRDCRAAWPEAGSRRPVIGCVSSWR